MLRLGVYRPSGFSILLVVHVLGEKFAVRVPRNYRKFIVTFRSG